MTTETFTDCEPAANHYIKGQFKKALFHYKNALERVIAIHGSKSKLVIEYQLNVNNAETKTLQQSADDDSEDADDAEDAPKRAQSKKSENDDDDSDSLPSVDEPAGVQDLDL